MTTSTDQTLAELGEAIDVELLAQALENVTAMTGDDAERWAPEIVAEYERLRGLP